MKLTTQASTTSAAPGTADRRSQPRRPQRLPGWVYTRDSSGREGVAEVTMRDSSVEGAGFVCDARLRVGQCVYLKIGLGPTRHPRAATVVYLRQRPADSRYDVGVRFADAPEASGGDSGDE